MSAEAAETLTSDLERLECHFTWGLRAEDADLNLLEVKSRDSVSLPSNSENNRKGRAYNRLAYIKHLQGFHQEALGYLAKAEEENADNAKHCVVTYGNFAWVHHLMGDDTKARTYLRKLEEFWESFPMQPEGTLPREVLGEKAWSLLKFSRNHCEEAKECFCDALQREPDDKEWNTGYAFALFRWDSFRKMRGEHIPLGSSRALKQLEKARALDPDNAMILVHLGLLYHSNGKRLQAWEYMKEALDVSPDNLGVVLKVGKFLRKARSYDRALNALIRTLKLFPDSPRLHHEIASTYRCKSFTNVGETRDRDLILRSMSHTKEEIRLNPSYLYPQLELALRYAEVGRHEKSECIFQEMFARRDLKPAEQQALHRIYGDFQKNHVKCITAALTHYMEGMKLQDVSSDWLMCRKRLVNIMNKTDRENAIYSEVEEFLFSFRHNSSSY